MRYNGRPFRGGGGVGRGGFKRQDLGPPQDYVEIGHVEMKGIKDVICKLTHSDVPYFNASIYNENHIELGRVDDVLGPVGAPMFTVIPLENLRPDSFDVNQKVYIDGRKLLSAQRIAANEMPQGKRGDKAGGKGHGGQGGFGRGGRGGASGRGGQSFNARGGGYRGGNRGVGGRGGGGRGVSNNRFQRSFGNRPRGGRSSM